MTAVLVACPVPRDLLAAQLRELQPVTRLVAAPQCMSEAHDLTSLTKCALTEGGCWSENASSALQVLLQGEELTVVVIDVETLRCVQQTGRNSAMKVFAIDNQPVLAVVTAAERWERLCWQGRVETVHRAVLQTVQLQVNEGLKEVLTAWEQRQNRLIELLDSHYSSKFKSSLLIFDACITKIEALVQHIKAQESTIIQVIQQISEKLDVYRLAPSLDAQFQVPLSKPIISTRPAPQQFVPEPLTKDWQVRVGKLEQSLGEQLSQEAVAVLMHIPGVDQLSDSRLIAELLGST